MLREKLLSALTHYTHYQATDKVSWHWRRKGGEISHERLEDITAVMADGRRTEEERQKKSERPLKSSFE